MNQVLKNSFSNWAGYITNVCIVFFLTPFIIHTLGKESYGLWILLISLTGYLSILDFGMRTSIGKYVAEFHTLKDFTNLNNFLNTALTSLTLVMLGILILGFIFIYFFLDTFNLPAHLFEEAHLIAYIIVINVAVGVPLSIPVGILTGLQRYDILNVVTIVINVVKAISIVYFLNIGYSLMALVILTVSYSLIQYIANAIAAFRIFHSYKIKLIYFNRSHFHKATSYGMASFVIKIADRIIFYTDTILIGKLLSTALISIYAPAESLIAYLRSMIISLITTLIPTVSSLESKNDYVSIRKIALTSTRYIGLIIFPITFGVFLLADDFIRLWLGPDFGETAIIMKILIIPQTLGLVQYGPEIILYGLNKHRSLAYLMTIIALTNVIFSLILVKYFGIYGIALGTALPLSLGQTIVTPLLAKKHFGLNIGLYLRESILPAIKGASVFGLLLWILRSQITVTHWGNFFLNIILTTIFSLPGIYYFSLTSDERIKLNLWFNNLTYTKGLCQIFTADNKPK